MHTRSMTRGSTAAAAASPKKSIEKKKKTTSAGTTSRQKGTTSASKLKVGDTLPGGTLTNLQGETFEVADLYKDTGLVAFCVPKANTGGCTKQANQFKESYEELKKKGFEVVCVSADSVKSQTNWKNKYDYPFLFGSDKERTVLKAWGATGKGGSSTTRSHFVAEKGGKLIEVAIGTSPAVSRDQVMKAVEGIGGGMMKDVGEKEQGGADTGVEKKEEAEMKKDDVEGGASTGVEKKEQDELNKDKEGKAKDEGNMEVEKKDAEEKPAAAANGGIEGNTAETGA